MTGFGSVSGSGETETEDNAAANGYRCAGCGNTEVFRALKRYWHKVEVDARGMVLENHGFHSDEDELEEVECSKCGAASAPNSPDGSSSPSDRGTATAWSPPRYRCLTCANETEFHRFYVEEARERLTADGDWVIVEAWEFADGGESTFGAICTPCAAADRDGEVVKMERGGEPEGEAGRGRTGPSAVTKKRPRRNRMSTETTNSQQEDFEYRCPECGSDHLKVYAEECKTVYINANGDIVDDAGGSHTEFVGPFECCECRHEWGYPKDHPSLDEGEE